MDLFDKCKSYYSDPEYARNLGYPTSPRMAQALGLYPYFIPIENSEGTEITIDNKKLIMIGSNNYLGLTNHPKVQEAAINAIRKYGTACTGSRLLNGTLRIHEELEERIAKFIGMEKALVFSSGYKVNLGTVTALIRKGDVVITDKEIHASIIDAAFLAKAQRDVDVRFFKHNRLDYLEDILKSYSPERNKLVIEEGVFSMGGDIAPIPDIIYLCKKYNAKLMIDEAHSFGVFGRGKGIVHQFNCTKDVDLIMGTFSKSFAGIGGFIAGKKDVIHWIQHFARSFIFSASLPPSVVATVDAAFDIIENEPELTEKVLKNAETVRKELNISGLNTGNSNSPIVPVIIGDQYKTMQAWHHLFESGIYTNVALPPAVPSAKSLLRTSFISTHTNEQLEKVISAFKRMKTKLNL